MQSKKWKNCFSILFAISFASLCFWILSVLIKVTIGGPAGSTATHNYGSESDGAKDDFNTFDENHIKETSKS